MRITIPVMMMCFYPIQWIGLLFLFPYPRAVGVPGWKILWGGTGVASGTGFHHRLKALIR